MNSQLSKTPVVLDGVSWSLCGDFAELVKAEAFFSRSADVNLAGAIVGVKDIDSALYACRQILPCALHAHHPEITWADAQAMLNRAVTQDDGSIVCSITRDIWPPKTAETEAANRNLRSDLESMARASGVCELKPGIAFGFNLGHVWRVLWPCALRRSRPELALGDARQLMTLEGLHLVIAMLGVLGETASQDERERFAQVVRAVASDDGELEFLFWAQAKGPWPDVAQA
jgi:hypothetical protein